MLDSPYSLDDAALLKEHLKCISDVSAPIPRRLAAVNELLNLVKAPENREVCVDAQRAHMCLHVRKALPLICARLYLCVHA